MIKPGTLCYLVHCDNGWECVNGRVVEVLEGPMLRRGSSDWYKITLPAKPWPVGLQDGVWLLHIDRVYAHRRNLLPISDPDQTTDITQTEEHTA